VNPFVLLNVQSALFSKLPASRISISSEEITESPETNGENREITVIRNRADTVLQPLIGTNDGFPCFKALVMGS
jgi:hypothetical protein